MNGDNTTDIVGLCVTNDRHLTSALKLRMAEGARPYRLVVTDSVDEAERMLMTWPRKVIIDFSLDRNTALWVLQKAADMREKANRNPRYPIDIFVLFTENNSASVSGNTTVLRKPILSTALLASVFGS